jgi:hypothetical protein
MLFLYLLIKIKKLFFFTIVKLSQFRFDLLNLVHQNSEMRIFQHEVKLVDVDNFADVDAQAMVLNT